MSDLIKRFKSNPIWIFSLVVGFIFLFVFAIYKDKFELALIPFAVVLGYLLIYFPKPLVLFLVFATPLSFNFENISAFGGIGFYFPTEPLLFALMCLYFVKILLGHKLNRQFATHPLTIAILFSLFWIGVTTATSTLPIVSFKFLLSRLWFVTVMYFMINQFFKDEKFINRFLAFFISGMAITIVYTLKVHADNAFSEQAAHWVMWPFFKDHTSYGAILALCFPFIVFYVSKSKFLSATMMLWTLVLVIFCVGLVLSYTRAAWVSLVGAMGVWALIKLRIDFKIVLALVGILFGFYLGFEDEIIRNIESNKQDSSGDFAEHIQSITNVSSDASNLERLNRWNSAIRMYEDKPLFGHGPGTYMFTYGVYQKYSDKTIISTNQGDAGNAHSEYLGPLSEQGLIGALSILAIFITSLFIGIKLYYKLDDQPHLQGIVMCIILGLVTYYLHGVLNNFLDTDKASVPVWGMMSMLVAIQLYHVKKPLQESGAE